MFGLLGFVTHQKQLLPVHSSNQQDRSSIQLLAKSLRNILVHTELVGQNLEDSGGRWGRDMRGGWVPIDLQDNNSLRHTLQRGWLGLKYIKKIHFFLFMVNDNPLVNAYQCRCSSVPRHTECIASH